MVVSLQSRLVAATPRNASKAKEAFALFDVVVRHRRPPTVATEGVTNTNQIPALDPFTDASVSNAADTLPSTEATATTSNIRGGWSMGISASGTQIDTTDWDSASTSPDSVSKRATRSQCRPESIDDASSHYSPRADSFLYPQSSSPAANTNIAMEHGATTVEEEAAADVICDVHGVVVRTYRGILDGSEDEDPEEMNPKRDEVQVAWQDGTVENIRKDRLQLVDRPFFTGDIVCNRRGDRVGLVIDVQQQADIRLLRPSHREGGGPTGSAAAIQTRVAAETSFSEATIRPSLLPLTPATATTTISPSSSSPFTAGTNISSAAITAANTPSSIHRAEGDRPRSPDAGNNIQFLGASTTSPSNQSQRAVGYFSSSSADADARSHTHAEEIARRTGAVAAAPPVEDTVKATHEEVFKSATGNTRGEQGPAEKQLGLLSSCPVKNSSFEERTPVGSEMCSNTTNRSDNDDASRNSATYIPFADAKEALSIETTRSVTGAAVAADRPVNGEPPPAAATAFTVSGSLPTRDEARAIHSASTAQQQFTEGLGTRRMPVESMRSVQFSSMQQSIKPQQPPLLWSLQAYDAGTVVLRDGWVGCIVSSDIDYLIQLDSGHQFVLEDGMEGVKAQPRQEYLVDVYIMFPSQRVYITGRWLRSFQQQLDERQEEGVGEGSAAVGSHRLCKGVVKSFAIRGVKVSFLVEPGASWRTSPTVPMATQPTTVDHADLLPVRQLVLRLGEPVYFNVNEAVSHAAYDDAGGVVAAPDTARGRGDSGATTVPLRSRAAAALREAANTDHHHGIGGEESSPSAVRATTHITATTRRTSLGVAEKKKEERKEHNTESGEVLPQQHQPEQDARTDRLRQRPQKRSADTLTEHLFSGSDSSSSSVQVDKNICGHPRTTVEEHDDALLHIDAPLQQQCEEVHTRQQKEMQLVTQSNNGETKLSYTEEKQLSNTRRKHQVHWKQKDQSQKSMEQSKVEPIYSLGVVDRLKTTCAVLWEDGEVTAAYPSRQLLPASVMRFPLGPPDYRLSLAVLPHMFVCRRRDSAVAAETSKPETCKDDPDEEQNTGATAVARRNTWWNRPPSYGGVEITATTQLEEELKAVEVVRTLLRLCREANVVGDDIAFPVSPVRLRFSPNGRQRSASRHSSVEYTASGGASIDEHDGAAEAATTGAEEAEGIPQKPAKTTAVGEEGRPAVTTFTDGSPRLRNTRARSEEADSSRHTNTAPCGAGSPTKATAALFHERNAKTDEEIGRENSRTARRRSSIIERERQHDSGARATSSSSNSSHIIEDTSERARDGGGDRAVASSATTSVLRCTEKEGVVTQQGIPKHANSDNSDESVWEDVEEEMKDEPSGGASVRHKHTQRKRRHRRLGNNRSTTNNSHTNNNSSDDGSRRDHSNGDNSSGYGSISNSNNNSVRKSSANTRNRPTTPSRHSSSSRDISGPCTSDASYALRRGSMRRGQRRADEEESQGSNNSRTSSFVSAAETEQTLRRHDNCRHHINGTIDEKKMLEALRIIHEVCRCLRAAAGEAAFGRHFYRRIPALSEGPAFLQRSSQRNHHQTNTEQQQAYSDQQQQQRQQQHQRPLARDPPLSQSSSLRENNEGAARGMTVCPNEETATEATGNDSTISSSATITAEMPTAMSSPRSNNSPLTNATDAVGQRSMRDTNNNRPTATTAATTTAATTTSATTTSATTTTATTTAATTTAAATTAAVTTATTASARMVATAVGVASSGGTIDDQDNSTGRSSRSHPDSHVSAASLRRERETIEEESDIERYVDASVAARRLNELMEKFFGGPFRKDDIFQLLELSRMSTPGLSSLGDALSEEASYGDAHFFSSTQLQSLFECFNILRNSDDLSTIDGKNRFSPSFSGSSGNGHTDSTEIGLVLQVNRKKTLAHVAWLRDIDAFFARAPTLRKKQQQQQMTVAPSSRQSSVSERQGRLACGNMFSRQISQYYAEAAEICRTAKFAAETRVEIIPISELCPVSRLLFVPGQLAQINKTVLPDACNPFTMSPTPCAAASMEAQESEEGIGCVTDDTAAARRASAAKAAATAAVADAAALAQKVRGKKWRLGLRKSEQQQQQQQQQLKQRQQQNLYHFQRQCRPVEEKTSYAKYKEEEEKSEEEDASIFVEILASCGGIVWARSIDGRVAPFSPLELLPINTRWCDPDSPTFESSDDEWIYDETDSDENSSEEGDDDDGTDSDSRYGSTETTDVSDNTRNTLSGCSTPGRSERSSSISDSQ